VPAPSTLLEAIYSPIFSPKYFYTEWEVKKLIANTKQYDFLKCEHKEFQQVCSVKIYKKAELDTLAAS
jgi:hypothetical protein